MLSYLPLIVRTLKRAPTPKLGDLFPNVDPSVVVNSLGVLPLNDLNRSPLENENFCFVGEKLRDSCVIDRALL